MKKFIIISLITIILMIPIFFGVYTEFLLERNLELFGIPIVILGLLLLLFIGWIINSFGFDVSNIESMRNHNVINALINGNYVILCFFFPITMIMEELIFRYYLISFFSSTLQLKTLSSILISSIAFSFYHIHTWFTFKNQRILVINLSYTLMLGLFNGYMFIMLGIIPCIIIHYLLAFYFYYYLYTKNFKKKMI
ncbi:MAG: CPBP family intramembrane glutamic endopeptidase [Candidatus Hermodarchaeota archaeon]